MRILLYILALCACAVVSVADVGPWGRGSDESLVSPLDSTMLTPIVSKKGFRAEGDEFQSVISDHPLYARVLFSITPTQSWANGIELTQITLNHEGAGATNPAKDSSAFFNYISVIVFRKDLARGVAAKDTITEDWRGVGAMVPFAWACGFNTPPAQRVWTPWASAMVMTRASSGDGVKTTFTFRPLIEGDSAWVITRRYPFNTDATPNLYYTVQWVNLQDVNRLPVRKISIICQDSMAAKYDFLPTAVCSTRCAMFYQANSYGPTYTVGSGIYDGDYGVANAAFKTGYQEHDLFAYELNNLPVTTTLAQGVAAGTANYIRVNRPTEWPSSSTNFEDYRVPGLRKKRTRNQVFIQPASLLGTDLGTWYNHNCYSDSGGTGSVMRVVVGGGGAVDSVNQAYAAGDKVTFTAGARYVSTSLEDYNLTSWYDAQTQTPFPMFHESGVLANNTLAIDGSGFGAWLAYRAYYPHLGNPPLWFDSGMKWYVQHTSGVNDASAASPRNPTQTCKYSFTTCVYHFDPYVAVSETLYFYFGSYYGTTMYDAAMRGSSNNCGGSTTQQQGRDSGTRQWRYIQYWPLSGVGMLPTDSIVSAQCSLMTTWVAGTSVIDVTAITQDWVEGTANAAPETGSCDWTNRGYTVSNPNGFSAVGGTSWASGAQAWSSAGGSHEGSVAGTLTISSGTQWRAWDVTTLVRRQWAGEAIYGFFFLTQSDDQAPQKEVIFDTKEKSGVGTDPRLWVKVFRRLS